MRVIVVDDEKIMLRSFLRMSKNIEQITQVDTFSDPLEAINYVQNNEVDVAFLDIQMPGISGVTLAAELFRIKPGIRIVFLTAYDNYIKEANVLNVDYYIVKPYSEDILRNTMIRLQQLQKQKQVKSVFIQTFGRFVVFKDGTPLPLSGKTKEILALVVSRRGKEISNEELYSTIWEDREYDNVKMKVYYNAVHRLKEKLQTAGCSELLISSSRGQLLNTDVCDCDYFSWLKGERSDRNRFEGEFMSEYSWGEEILASLVDSGAH